MGASDQASERRGWWWSRITPNEIGAFIEDVELFLNQIFKEDEDSCHAFNTNAREDAEQMLEDLKRYHTLPEPVVAGARLGQERNTHGSVNALIGAFTNVK